MRLVPALTIVAALAAASSPVDLSAAQASRQSPAPEPGSPSQRTAVPEATLKQVHDLVAASRHDEAVALLDTLLAGSPRDRRLYELKIEARTATGDHKAVLATYDDFVAVNQVDDAALLALVARSELKRVAASATPERYAALAALVRAGDATSATVLQTLAAQTKDEGAAAAAKSALARAGDAPARRDIVERARSGGRAEVLAALSLPPAPDESPAAMRPAIVAGLRHADVVVQEKALEAAAHSADPSLVADVRRLTASSDKVVKLRAAVAMHRLGVTEQDTLLRQSLESGPPDAKIIAAEAFAGTDGAWRASIRPLLASLDGTFRVDAAGLLAGEPESNAVIESALGDPNLYVRSAALRALSERGTASLPQLRRLMRDPAAPVRQLAAEVLLELSATR
jgi:hypothetical protein